MRGDPSGGGEVARERIAQVGRDLKNRRNIDAYVVAALALVFAVLSVAGDILPDGLRWAVLLAGVGLLVYRITLPAQLAYVADEALSDRGSFDATPFSARLDNAHEVWIFAPTAVNLLNIQHVEALRSKVLARPGGVVRIVVLDPDEDAAVRLAARQLDDSVDFPSQTLQTSLESTLQRLRLMSTWNIPGSLECRLLGYNPGFSLVAIDPGTRHGTVIVEFHGFHNEATTSRMHLELTRAIAPRWYAYWSDQFHHIWHAARALTP
jgi:hypothetical protein